MGANYTTITENLNFGLIRTIYIKETERDGRIAAGVFSLGLSELAEHRNVKVVYTRHEIPLGSTIEEARQNSQNKARELEGQGKYLEASEWYNVTFDIEQTDSKRVKALYYNSIGDNFMNQNKYHQARSNFDTAYSIYGSQEYRNKSKNARAEYENQLGEHYLRQGKYEEAVRMFQSASNTCYLFYSGKQKFQKNINEAQAHINRIREEARKVEEEKRRKEEARKRAEEEKRRKEEEARVKAEEEAKKAKEERLKRENEKIIKILNQAMENGKNGRTEQAIDRYMEALALIKKLESVSENSDAYNALLKVINGLIQNDAFDEAADAISEGKTLFPEKKQDLDRLKELVDNDDWSEDFLEKFLMEKDQKEIITTIDY